MAVRILGPAASGPNDVIRKSELDAAVAAASGGGGSTGWVEAEIDFGAQARRDKRIVVTAASVTPSSKVSVVQSGEPATGRVGYDAEWDSVSYAAVPGTGEFTLLAHASGRIVGKRKFQYQIG